jgi:osmotically inducible protein OsmC
MAAVEREATCIWQGELMKGEGTVNGGSGALSDLGMTFATRAGDPEGHTSPEELIAAAHAGCYAMSLSNRLKTGSDATAERLTVKATCSLDRVDAGLKLTTMDLDVTGSVPGVDQAEFEAAARDAEASCPVSNALRGNMQINLSATLEGS